MAILVFTATFASFSSARATGDPARGAKEFGVCAACHSLNPELNKTGPSLATVWGRKAGGLPSFGRYSPALKGSGAVWNEASLDGWLINPAGYIPNNNMTFPGIPDAKVRTDIIAFLKAVGETGRGGPPVDIPAAYTATPLNLRELKPDQEVTAIRSCRDSYFVATADGRIRPFWDESLRFETDASPLGPFPGKPAILPSGMLGDRAAVIFAQPSEISSFIRQKC
ncbi:MAG: c-type cytochrome [Alphaproteobacteria bacterium]|nr:c-type cytochrome [Alphaproteobacteria bacterium]